MQRPIPATRSLSRHEAQKALSHVRAYLKERGYTLKPYQMCAKMEHYGVGYAVFVGIQPDADLDNALSALSKESCTVVDSFLTWDFSAMTHST